MTTATERIPDDAGVPSADASRAEPDPRRWVVLGVVAIAQLMVVLDATIVNIALPKAQASLHISTANRQWIVTAYTLAFGGLLLLGGRIADYAGRKRTFVWGLIGFAFASALGGIAPNAGLLFAARALQGALAAVLAPAALSLITVTFTEPKERAQAFGVWGAIAAGGSAVGLIMGGVLTEYASWRWCLLVNVPVAVAAALVAIPTLRESRVDVGDRSYDVSGGLSVTVGLVALVYGFTKAGEDGWSNSVTIVSLVIAVVLLAAFVVIETRSKAPLLPLRVPGDRDRGGSFITSVLVGAGFLAMFLFMTYYLQSTLGYSPLRTGFAYLPFSAGVIVAAGIAAQLMPRLGAKIPMLIGGVLLTVGLLLLTRIGAHTAYVSHVLPPFLVMSFGLGLLFIPLSSAALFGVSDDDAGVASALVNSTQQIGGSLGTALLNTVFTTVYGTYLASHAHLGEVAKVNAAIHGYRLAFLGAALMIAACLPVLLFLVRWGKNDTAPATALPPV